MSANETSRQAYAELMESGAIGHQALDVLAVVWLSQFCLTRNEIAERSGLRLSSVRGRVNDLVAVGMLESVGKRQCRMTGRTAEQLQVTRKGMAAVGKAREVV
ncbi:hypothetical protein [Guyparkeria halopsychrophila]|uniref:hypothetical protein n=1 Tax=Guyparkeria halopsychrophila TaxID=3139421 RepID=UPI0037C8D8CA